MDIAFGDAKLKKYANDDKLGSRKLGSKVFKKYKMRLDQLRASETLEDVRHQPGRFHELTADKKGKWACDLVHPYRLLFEPRENPIPINENGNYIWKEIKGVTILTIEDYH